MSTQLCKGTPNLGLGLKMGCSMGSGGTSPGRRGKGVCGEWLSPGHGGKVKPLGLSPREGRVLLGTQVSGASLGQGLTEGLGEG